MKRRWVLLAVVCSVIVSNAGAAVQNDSAKTAHRWVAAKFLGVEEPLVSTQPYLEVHLEPDSLVRDRIQDHPLLIAGQTFDKGMAMRSAGDIVIHLPAGARMFDAVLGVDSNDVGYYSNTGRGSVVASIEAGGQQLYESPVLHEGMKGIPIHVQIGSAHELTLHLKAVGTRPATYQAEWDQADWANAIITLTDGTKMPLSTIPEASADREYSLTPPFSFRYGNVDSAKLLKSWPVQRHSRALHDQPTEYTSIYEDPATHLIVRCVAVAYRDFPIVEWTVYFKNGGSERTPILENIQPDILAINPVTIPESHNCQRCSDFLARSQPEMR